MLHFEEKYHAYIDKVANNIAEYTLKFIGALIVLIVGIWLARKIAQTTKRLIGKSKLDKMLVSFIANIVYFSLLITTVLIAISALGIETTSFVAIIGAIGVTIGLALQSSLANVGATVIIIIFRPFKIGDMIEVDSKMGKVEDTNLFATKLATIDNTVIIIPNSKIVTSNVINYTDKQIRLVEHIVGISYNDDIKKTKNILIQLLLKEEKVLNDPKSFVGIKELGSSSVNFTVRAWVKTDDYWEVYFHLLEAIKLAFDKEGITIPFNQLDLHIKEKK